MVAYSSGCTGPSFWYRDGTVWQILGVSLVTSKLLGSLCRLFSWSSSTFMAEMGLGEVGLVLFARMFWMSWFLKWEIGCFVIGLLDWFSMSWALGDLQICYFETELDLLFWMLPPDFRDFVSTLGDSFWFISYSKLRSADNLCLAFSLLSPSPASPPPAGILSYFLSIFRL